MSASVTSRLEASIKAGDDYFIVQQVPGFAAGASVQINQVTKTVAAGWVAPVFTTLAQYGNNVHVPVTTPFLISHVQGAPVVWTDANASVVQAD